MCKQHNGENWLQQQQCCQLSQHSCTHNSIKHRINRTAEPMPKCCCLGEWLCIRKDTKQQQQQCLQRGGSRAVGPNGLYKRLSRPASYRKGRNVDGIQSGGGLPSPSSPALIETLSQVGHRRAGTPGLSRRAGTKLGQLGRRIGTFLSGLANQACRYKGRLGRFYNPVVAMQHVHLCNTPPPSDTQPKNTFSVFEYFTQFLCWEVCGNICTINCTYMKRFTKS